ncbi:MAG: hypothetical protein HY342_04315 [Candidatus Lambdaproteobacteria bacterium]|nr:hypothetical protein [Candidatus Lambdaproteobacteria bacterium]
MKYGLLIAVFIALQCSVAAAATYECKATKADTAVTLPKNYLEQYQHSLKLQEQTEVVRVGRCSFAQSMGRVTCDWYDVDRVEFDERAGLKKYYVFSAQFNLQIFLANLSFLEDNGRGGIYWGQCVVAEP